MKKIHSGTLRRCSVGRTAEPAVIPGLSSRRLKPYAPQDSALFSEEESTLRAIGWIKKQSTTFHLRFCALALTSRFRSGLNRKRILNGRRCFRWAATTGM